MQLVLVEQPTALTGGRERERERGREEVNKELTSPGEVGNTFPQAWVLIASPKYILKKMKTYVDLMVIQRSCSSFLVSVNLASPAFAEAIIPALLTKESVSVDFP